ncbi:hypothetical protein E4U11_007471 [Claviceps purpurea]|nr:hypothetical protein E4U11_007471 [Claviceps purpurea]
MRAVHHENEKTTGGRTAARAAETSTTHSAPLPPSRPCSGCSKRRPVTDFPLKNPLGDAHGERYRVCAPYKVKRDNRRPPRRGPNQTAPPHPEQLDEQLDEQDADEQDDGPPPARPRQETPAIDLDSVPKQHCSGWELSDFPSKNNRILLTCVRCKVRQQNRRPPRRQTAPPQIGQEDVAGQENIAPRPVRRARQSSAAAERKRTAAVEKALAAALRVTEAIARQAEAIARHARVQAEPTMAAVAKAEAVRRVVRATQKASRAMRASQEARRAAVLQESMNAAAAAQAKVEAARLAAYRPRFGPISTVPSRS